MFELTIYFISNNSYHCDNLVGAAGSSRIIRIRQFERRHHTDIIYYIYIHTYPLIDILVSVDGYNLITRNRIP